MKNSTTPKRSEIAKSDKWNIELLFKNEEEWEAALASIPEGGKEILKYKEAFSKPETIDAATLLACLKASTGVDRIAEKVGTNAQNVSGMERGIRAISITMAKKLGKIFGTNYRNFL